MRSFFLVFVFFVCFMSAHTQVRQIPVEEFFRLPPMAGFRLSPSGHTIAFLQPYNNRMNIFISDTSLQKPRRLTNIQDRDLATYFFKTDNKIFYLKDDGGDENYHIYELDVRTAKTRDITPYKGVKASILDVLEDRPNEMLIMMNKNNPQLFDVYRYFLKTGKLQLEMKNPGGVTNVITDHNGVIRIAIKTDGVETELLYRKDAKTPFASVKKTSFRNTLAPLFFTFDNQYLYALSNLKADKNEIVILDPATGETVPSNNHTTELPDDVFYRHPRVDVSGMGYSHKRKVLTVISYVETKPERVFLDPHSEQLFKNVQAQVGDDVVLSFVSHNRDEDKFIVMAYSDRKRGTIYFYDLSNNSLRKLADLTPGLAADELAQMKPISYQSSDGLTIHGYLTLPVGKEAKNLPIVVIPHGGPWARDVWGYRAEVQLLANRGYGVLQMNFRGSTGYGKKFWEASFKQWGKNMQQDITDGVKWLIDQGIANPKKIAIYGASYGGYATLAGLTLTPNLYACGVDYVGVSNLFTFMKTIPPYWKPMLDMLHEMVGDPEKDKVQLEMTSPALNADKIQVPLFIAQGAKDPRVNKNESDQMVEAMRKRGIEVEYLVKENEGHGFHNEENQFEFYNKMVDFLAKYL